MSVQTGTKKKNEGGIAETVRVVINALIIALVIRTLLFQPFNIPSESMKATLLVGDYLFVSKYSYGYTHYSLPFSPRLFSGRIFGSALKRGDVVVFRLPRDDSVDYIKRVVGRAARQAVSRDAAEWRLLRHDDSDRQRLPRQHPGLYGAAGSLFHDGRQSR